DPRAVANSMLQSTFSSGLRLANTVEDAIALYRQYVEATDPYKHYENLMRIRYESLYHDPVTALHTICDFIGIDTRGEEVERIVQANTTKPQTLASNDFRKGKIDSYKEELEQEDLARIEQ